MLAATILWLFLLELLSLLAYPLAYRVFARFPDRGWALSKPMGLLLVGFGIWVLGLSHVIPNSRWSVMLAMVALSVLSWLAVRSRLPELRATLRTNLRNIAATEAVFIAAFVAVVLLRIAVPDIRHTEQPMDLMLLNSVVTSTSFPPTDAWLAGNSVSYYYFGYLMMGAVTMLSGIATPVAYNLGLATAAAMGAVAAFGLTLNLVRLASGSFRASVLTGLAAVFLLMIASNLAGTMELAISSGAGDAQFWQGNGIDFARATGEPSAAWRPTDLWWWFDASRVVSGAITEFPAFSFILGDLHPHVMSIGFLLLVAGLAFQIYLQPGLLRIGALRSQWPLALTLVLALGALAAINIWDLPVGIAMVGGAVFLHAARHGLQVPKRFGRAVAGLIALLAMSLFLFLPFYLTLESNVGGLVALRGIVTRPIQLLGIWSVTGTLALVFLATVARSGVRVGGRPLMRLSFSALAGFAPVVLWMQSVEGKVFWLTIAIVGVVLVLFSMTQMGFRLPKMDEMPLSIGNPTVSIVGGALLVGGLLWYGVAHGEAGVGGKEVALGRMAIVVPMAAVVSLSVYFAWSLARRDAEMDGPERALFRFGDRLGTIVPVLGLLAIASALIMGSELFFVGDVFGGRVNTLFKFYYQAWILMAIVAAFGLWHVSGMWNRSVLVGRVGVVVWTSVLVLTMGAVTYFPVAAVATRMDENGTLPTLDGQRYLEREAPAELALIQWIRERVARDALVVEAPIVPCANEPNGCHSYEPAARVSWSTGRPTILGWLGHERQWRRSHDELGSRTEHIREIYETLDPMRARELLAKYDARYVVVGPRERNAYGLDGIAKFNELGWPALVAGGPGSPLVLYELAIDGEDT